MRGICIGRVVICCGKCEVHYAPVSLFITHLADKPRATVPRRYKSKAYAIFTPYLTRVHLCAHM